MLDSENTNHMLLSIIVINSSSISNDDLKDVLKPFTIKKWYTNEVSAIEIVNPLHALIIYACEPTSQAQLHFQRLLDDYSDARFIGVCTSYDKTIADLCWQHDSGYFLTTDGLASLPALVKKSLADYKRIHTQSVMTQQYQQALFQLTTRPLYTDLDFPAFLNDVATITSQTLGVSRVSIWRLEDDGHHMVCTVLYQAEDDTLTSGMEIDDTTYPRYFDALRNQRVVVANDARTDSQTSEFTANYLDPLGIVSMLDASIRQGGELRGIVCAENIHTIREWTQEEQAFVLSIASLLAQAMVYEKRHYAEKALYENLIYLKQAEQIAQVGYFRLDLQSGDVTWSDGTYRLFGQPIGKEINLDIYKQLIPPEGFSTVMEAVAKTVDTHQPYHVQHNIYLDNGIQKQILAIGKPEIDNNGKVSHIFGVVQDMTERVKAEERERAFIVQKERVTFLTDFFGTISHDIKTPLTVIKTVLFLLQNARNTEERDRRVRQIAGQVDIISDYITDMLIIARLDSMPAFEPERVNISAMLQDVSDKLQPTIDSKNQSFVVVDTATQHSVPAEPQQLQRVFVNLLENAINYTSANGNITLSIDNDGDFVRIRLHDNGIGIEPEAIAHIFTPFFRTQKAKQMIDTGTGLGMSIVKRMLDRHNGTITVESQINEGTTFTIHLPLAE